jgi:tetratricopeptide (TPR) repeat protein
MTRIVTILALLLALSLAGCESSQPTPEQGQAAIEQTQKEQLVEQIDRRYENPEAHYKLGKIYYNEGALDKADFEYRVAVGFDPVHYRAHAGIVRIAADRKDSQGARAIAELYISQTAVSAENSLRLGQAFASENLDEYALSCYYQAIGLDPEMAEPYKLIGLHFLKAGDTVRAEENLRRSFELNPYQPDVSGELGRLGVTVTTPHQAPETILQ